MKSAWRLLLLLMLAGPLLAEQHALSDETPIRLYPILHAGKWGYIDKAGKMVVEPRFDGAAPFSDGMGPVNLGGKWGFVDAGGYLTIPPQFDDVLNFSEGLCAVRVGAKWAFIEKSGAFRGRARYGEARSFSEGVAPVSFGRKWGFVNRDMRVAIPARFDGAWPFTEGRAPVKVGDRWGYIDKSGKVVIEPCYYWVDNFSEGLAFVEGGEGHEGYINTRGEFVIRRRFYKAHPFSNGVAAVVPEAGGRYVLINKQGVKVSDSEYEWVDLFSEGLAGASLDSGFGYIDGKGNLIMQTDFAAGWRFHGGLAEVRARDGKRGYIDAAGKFVWGPADPGYEKPSPPRYVLPSAEQVLEARIVGPPSVAAKQVSWIGNPYRHRYPDNSPSVFARTIWDMILYDGRIYVGCGDLWENAGPVEIYSFAPGEEKFVLEYIAADEMVSKFYVFDGRLVIPGADPRDSWEFGNIYIKESGEWRKVRTLPNGLHCFSLAYLNGGLLAGISTEHTPNVLVSRDWGRSWTPVVWNAYWLRPLFTFEGKLRAFGSRNDFCTLEGGVLFSEEMIPELQRMTPRPQDDYPRLRYSDVIEFRRGLIITTSDFGQYLWNRPYPLFYLAPGQTRPRMISVFTKKNVMDVIARPKALYALCTRATGRGFENSIYASKDVRNWRCIATFATDGFARSFEEAGGVFYVGIGCQLGATLPNSTGDILRVVPKR